MRILGIESSCDETAAAVVEDGKVVLSDVIASQIEIHRRFGGVVPEIASRNHTAAVKSVVDEALKQAGMTLSDVDAIAVTYGAGLLGALIVGVSYAKALSYASGKPLYGVSHIKGHIAANYLSHGVKPPYLCLLVSGGHTAILRVNTYEEFDMLGTTRDDAAGEAFDKVARVLGLPYPGGPEIEKLALNGEAVIEFPKPQLKETGEMYKGREIKRLDFSFSGLKTAVINYLNNEKARQNAINSADIAASFQKTAVDMLVENTIKAAQETGLKTVAIAGGVSANKYLQARMESEGAKLGLQVVYPPLRLSTDNASMIAAAAHYMIESGCKPAGMELDAQAVVKLG